MEYERYQFKSKMLKGLISSSIYINEDKTYISGWTSGKRIGATVLMYLYKNAFNFHRFPIWEDRHFTERVFTMQDNEENLKSLLMDETFLREHDNMIEEIKAVYEHTQKSLDINYKGEDYVELRRNLSGEYASILLQIKASALEKNEKIVKIGADILNSFTSSFGSYGMDAHIDMKIPKKDILCYSNVLDWSVMESNEFIVINRSRDGLIEIPVDRIFKTHDIRSENIENRWRIVNYQKSPYHFVNFAMNTQVNFYKPEKLRSPTKPNIVCKLLKKTNKCCEIY